VGVDVAGHRGELLPEIFDSPLRGPGVRFGGNAACFGQPGDLGQTARAEGFGELFELDGGPARSVELPGHQPRGPALSVWRRSPAGPCVQDHERAEVVPDYSGRIVHVHQRGGDTLHRAPRQPFEIALARRAIKYGAQVIGIVRGKTKLGTLAHDEGEPVERRARDDAALVMAQFGPGVGEVNVEDRETFIGDELAQEVACLGPDGADVEAPVAAKPVAGISPIPSRPLNPEEVYLRAGLALLSEERSFAHADLQLDRMIVSEQRPPVDGPRQTFQIKPDRLDDQLVVHLHAFGILLVRRA